MRRMQGGGQSGIFNFAKSRAKIISHDKPKTTFMDVAGCDEAKVELQEIVEFLKHSSKYKKLGAKIPKFFNFSAQIINSFNDLFETSISGQFR